MDQLIQLFSTVALLLFVYASAWFIISIIKKRNDLADVAWGLGYSLVCLYLFIAQPISSVAILLYSLVVIWGLRLSIHIYLRNRGKKEDFRYLQWREAWGKSFYWRSYLQVYLLQAFFLLIIISPLLLVAASPPLGWSIFTWVGFLMWSTGFFFQAVGDYQLSVFVKNKKNKGDIMQSGLWKFTRHPNYFGEIVMWWGIFVIVLPLPGSYWIIVSPLTITFLIAFVSGVPMLEKKYDGNPNYEAYRKSTPALFPKLWKGKL
ncbi:MAG TPA: steroid 5-alpha reductase [Cytophagales bacterium]|nr:steroid 5-alpha reductase [Cytophagales bacterium]